MSKTTEGAVVVEPMRPALISIGGSCRYLGDISRAKFYADILPALDVCKLGARTMVTVESLDRLIAANRRVALRAQNSDQPFPVAI